MSVGREGPEVTAPAPAPVFGEPTHQLSVAGASDHCVNCSAPLAGDQRYCVNCGERRGKWFNFTIGRGGCDLRQ